MHCQLTPQRTAPLRRNSIRFLRLLFPALKRPAPPVKPNHAEPSLHCPVEHDSEPNWHFGRERNDIA